MSPDGQDQRHRTAASKYDHLYDDMIMERIKIVGGTGKWIKIFHTLLSGQGIYTLLGVSSPASSSSSSAFSGTFYECPLWQRTSPLLGQRTLFVR